MINFASLLSDSGKWCEECVKEQMDIPYPEKMQTLRDLRLGVGVRVLADFAVI